MHPSAEAVRATGDRAPDAPAVPAPLVRRLWRWLDPRPSWRSLREDPSTHRRFAAGVAVGVFIATLPLYPLQTVISLGVARVLRLQPLSVVAGSQLSTPPVGVLLVGGSVWLGSLLLHGDGGVAPAPTSLFSVPWRLLLAWSFGSVVLGALLAPIGYVAARVLLGSLLRSR